MLRQSIWLGLLIMLMTAPLSMDNNPKEEMQRDVYIDEIGEAVDKNSYR